MGSLQIESTPPRARFRASWCEIRCTGTTPVDLHRICGVEVRVRIWMAGYRGVERYLSPASEGDATVSVVLRPLPDAGPAEATATPGRKPALDCWEELGDASPCDF